MMQTGRRERGRGRAGMRQRFGAFDVPPATQKGWRHLPCPGLVLGRFHWGCERGWMPSTGTRSGMGWGRARGDGNNELRARDPHFQALGADSRLNFTVAPRGYTVQVTAPFANALRVLGFKNSSFYIPSPQPVIHLSFLSQKLQGRILQHLVCHPWILLMLIKKSVTLVDKSTYLIIIGRIDIFLIAPHIPQMK